jgi:hypothetical protein
VFSTVHGSAQGAAMNQWHRCLPSEPMTIVGLSESLPPAKISVSTATAHGGSFLSLFLVIFFVHSTGILCRIGTKHEISVDKICMMMTRLACNRAIESSYWRMDNDPHVGLLMVMCFTGYRLNWNSWI